MELFIVPICKESSLHYWQEKKERATLRKIALIVFKDEKTLKLLEGASLIAGSHEEKMKDGLVLPMISVLESKYYDKWLHSGHKVLLEEREEGNSRLTNVFSYSSSGYLLATTDEGVIFLGFKGSLYPQMTAVACPHKRHIRNTKTGNPFTPQYRGYCFQASRVQRELRIGNKKYSGLLSGERRIYLYSAGRIHNVRMQMEKSHYASPYDEVSSKGNTPFLIVFHAKSSYEAANKEINARKEALKAAMQKAGEVKAGEAKAQKLVVEAYLRICFRWRWKIHIHVVKMKLNQFMFSTILPVSASLEILE
eukprot:Gb_31862 [translate_table: standard]